MISVIATIELQPGKRDDFLREFHQVVPLVRGEAGCVEYFPAVDAVTDITAQPPGRLDTVVVIEKWESVAALKAHLVAPHMLAYRLKVKDLVLQTTVHVLDPA